MKTAVKIGALYLAVVGAATFASGSMTNSPTMDSVAKMPSLGSLMSSTGTTAAALDIGGAAVLFFLVPRYL
jgi:hypothetical protein